MIKYLHKKEGTIDNFIGILVGIFAIILISAMFLDQLVKPIKSIKLDQIARKYALKMEIHGGLPSSELENLKDELRQRNFKLQGDSSDYDTKIILKPSSNTANFGDDVSIDIQHTHEYAQLGLDGFNVIRNPKTLIISAKKSTVSKKAN